MKIVVNVDYMTWVDTLRAIRECLNADEEFEFLSSYHCELISNFLDSMEG